MAASIVAYRKYGVSPKIISWLMQNSQEITHYRDAMEQYYLLFWEGKYLINKTIDGLIWRGGTSYVVVYAKNCTRGYVIAHPNEQFSVSFRKAMPEYDLPAYCYISQANKLEY
jgi:hypothetical protein